MQLELFNLLTPSATVNLPSPMQNGADGFDDILHQAQGLDLVDLSNTVDLQPDAPQMMSLDQPTTLVDMASAMVAMASLDAANLDRSSGQSLPVDTLVDNEEMLLRLQAFVAQVAGMQSTEEMTGTLRQFDQVDLTAMREGLVQTSTETMAPTHERVAGEVEAITRRLQELGVDVVQLSRAVRQLVADMGPAVETTAQPQSVNGVDAADTALQSTAAVGAQTGVVDPAALDAIAKAIMGAAVPSVGSGLPASVGVPTPQPVDAAQVAAALTVREGSVPVEARPPELPLTPAALTTSESVPSMPVELEARPRVDIPLRQFAEGEVRRLNLNERIATTNATIGPLQESSGLSREVAPLTSIDQMVRGVSAGLESRPAAVEPAPTAHALLTRTEAPAAKPFTMSNEVADVWVKNTGEVPERILQQVSRMHANALRMQAGGATDFVQRLTLNLFPSELGQVEVSLRAADQVSVTFNAREGATRDLLEAGVTRLRQMFEEQGLNLGDVDVGGRFSGEGTEHRGESRGQPSLVAEEVAPDVIDTQEQVGNQDDGLHVVA